MIGMNGLSREQFERASQLLKAGHSPKEVAKELMISVKRLAIAFNNCYTICNPHEGEDL